MLRGKRNLEGKAFPKQSTRRQVPRSESTEDMITLRVRVGVELQRLKGYCDRTWALWAVDPIHIISLIDESVALCEWIKLGVLGRATVIDKLQGATRME